MEENIYNDTNDLYKAGRECEILFARHLKSKPDSIEWLGIVNNIHYHEDEETQKQGIDYTITSTSGILTIDVKKDAWLGQTGNLLAEYKVYYGNGYEGKGWMLYGRSRFIAFVNPNTNTLYIVDLDNFRQDALDYFIKVGFHAKTKLVSKIKGRRAWNVMIPEEECERSFRKYKL